jgi:hypothetical protein
MQAEHKGTDRTRRGRVPVLREVEMEVAPGQTPQFGADHTQFVGPSTHRADGVSKG